jgi:hypothetical protein
MSDLINKINAAINEKINCGYNRSELIIYLDYDCHAKLMNETNLSIEDGAVLDVEFKVIKLHEPFAVILKRLAYRAVK